MSLSVKTQGGGGGLFASIFVKGLSETDAVYATKDGVVRNGVWTTKQGTVSVSIPTMTSNTEPSGECIYASYDSNAGQYPYYAFNGNTISQTPYAAGVYGTSCTGQYIGYKFDEAIMISHVEAYLSSGNSGVITLQLQTSLNGSEWENQGSAFSAVQSDSVTLTEYDFATPINAQYVRFLCTGYTASGDNRLKAWLFQVDGYREEIVGGFLISKIKDLGTWTVTATDGVKTETQDVLVDVATEYEIEINLNRTYLYREGDEFEDITGGWSNDGYSAGGYSFSAPIKYDTYMRVENNGVSVTGGVGNQTPIDITGYTNVCMLITSNDAEVWILSSGKNAEANRIAGGAFTCTEEVKKWDVSGHSGTVNIAIYGYRWSTSRSADIYQVWLE